MKTHHILFAAAIWVITLICLFLCRIKPVPPVIDTNEQYIADSIRIEQLTELLSFKDSLLQANSKHDTVIVTRWRTKIDSIPYMPDEVIVQMYDTLTQDSVIMYEDRFCFNRPQIDTITTMIYEGKECSERLDNCQKGMQIQDSMREIQDSIIVLQRDQNKQLREIIYTNEATFQKELKRWRRRAFVGGIVGIVGVVLGVLK